MAAIFRDWLNDPQASASLVIALVAGTWAVAQFRPVARERRRETFEAMANHYVELRAARDAAVPRFPPLLAIGQAKVLAASAEAPNAEASDHRQKISEELRDWRRFDIAFTSAREIMQSEAKFRALLCAVEEIRLWRETSGLVIGSQRYPLEVLEAAEALAHDVNVFLFHYENGNYPARQTLGLLHRSLAVVSKTTEPVVWERSVNADARWGRRALRIGIAAQHFNDVTRIHCTSDLTWKGSEGNHLVHPRLRRNVSGASVLTDSPVRARFLPSLRIRLRSWYWYAVGLVSPVPKLWPLSYGGRRLSGHRRDENRVADLLGVALGRHSLSEERPSFDFGWDLQSLKLQQRKRVRAQRREMGRLAWLWLPKATHGDG